jgi:hypothetical protein
MEVSGSEFNTLFLGKLDEPDGHIKAAKAGGAYVRLRLREKAVNRHILPVETLTKDDVTRSVAHDFPVKIVDIEQNSSAVSLNFRGSSNARYVVGKRYEIPFQKIESDEFEADEAELMMSDYPVSKTIEDQTVRDMDRTEDGVFFDYSRQVTAATAQTFTAAGAIDREFIANCKNTMEDALELAVDCMVWHKSDWNDWGTLPASDVGNDLASEMTVGGYKYEKASNTRLIVTIKNLALGENQLLGPGYFWLYTAPSYLGCSYTLGDVRFQIKKDGSLISWKSWYYRGMGFGNRDSIVQGRLT